MNVLHPQDMKNTTPQQPPEQPNKTQQPDHDGTNSEMETCHVKCRVSSPAPEVGANHEVKEEEAMRADESEEDNGREKLKRHRIEVAGNVWIPDIWGQEQLLKDWIDCSAFNDSLVPHGIMSARAALVEEGRRANSGGFRIENRTEDAVCEVSQNHGYHQEHIVGEKLSPTLQHG
ncbi:hypothetical protein ERO13_1Z049556v2 [Gossypium hirsutum]|uniref:Protein BIC1 isoform X1 n=1 Tax=Gossypium hirsutum TaxID=3635 RepID=A0A1U8NGE3_GOSHI|nr:protein BIC1-like isoform X1 [Gossypium hirsutum]XP_040966472.1 protein BIC1-like isoform X1 [Gossypium hirsutum]KAG4109184.1 hypothetical protein ERO13_1Z049556v2 [Gossypium hirsutum]